MCDYDSSSHVKLWMFQSEDELTECRQRANRLAIQFISSHKKKKNKKQKDKTEESDPSSNSNGLPTKFPVQNFAHEYSKNRLSGTIMTANKSNQNDDDDDDDDNNNNKSRSKFLTPEEELQMVDFYAGRIPSLIGPKAEVSRLQRDPKVPATTVLLYRRFYLSNSVMMFDPKVIMTAAAFLASKVEDCMTNILYLEEGTKRMDAPVPQSDILALELNLLEGIRFDLLCFHPYKAVLAFSQDLRQFVKTKVGRGMVQLLSPSNSGEAAAAAAADNSNRPVVGNDLMELHADALRLVDEICTLSDVPLLFSPGQVGLACLVLSNERCRTVRVDFMAYLDHRFQQKKDDLVLMKQKLPLICNKIRALKAQNNFVDPDIGALKVIHKKLKKCRLWSTEKLKNNNKDNKSNSSSGNKNKGGSSSGNKRKSADNDEDAAAASEAKKVKAGADQ